MLKDWGVSDSVGGVADRHGGAPDTVRGVANTAGGVINTVRSVANPIGCVSATVWTSQQGLLLVCQRPHVLLPNR